MKRVWYTIFGQNMSEQQAQRLDTVYFLIAPDFDEGPLILLAGKLRNAGISVELIGIEHGLVSGSHGIALKTDSIVSDLPDLPPKMIVFPGGRRSLFRLLVDPRVRKLVQKTVAQQGHIVAIGDVSALLWEDGILASSPDRLIDISNVNLLIEPQVIINLLL